jgi:hypothetical protein
MGRAEPQRTRGGACEVYPNFRGNRYRKRRSTQLPLPSQAGIEDAQHHLIRLIRTLDRPWLERKIDA